MRQISIYRRDEFASDSEASDATFATPHRVDEAGKGRKRKPVYAMGRVPEVAREVTQGAEWSGTTMPSMPNVFQSPRQTEAEEPTLGSEYQDEDLASSPGRGGDPKVKVTLKRVPSSSSPSGSSASWDIKRADDELDEEEVEEKRSSTRQPHTAKKAASTKKLDKVVLNLKKTAGNNWNVSSATSSGASETESESVNTSDISLKEIQTKRRGRKSKTAPVKKVHPSKIEDVKADLVEKEAIDGCEVDPGNLIMPTKDHPKASTPQKPLSNTESSVSETPDSESKKPPAPKRPATKTPVKTYTRKKGSSTMESSITNRITMNTGLPVTVTILDDSPSPATTTGIDAPIASSSTQNIGSSIFSSANDMSDFNIREIRDMSRQITASQEEQIPEYRSLLKAIGVGSVTESAAFMRKIQQSLKLTPGTGVDSKPELTFHVGNSKAAIDLPSETLDVSSSKDKGAKVLLTAESDGIEGETMRSTFSQKLPQVVVKKGRPPKQKQLQQQQQRQQQQQQQHEDCELAMMPPEPVSGASGHPPTMVQPAPSRFNAEVDLQQPLPRYAEVDMWPEILSEEELARQAGLNYELLKNGTIRNFKYNVGLLMNSYQCPPEWLNGGIDPVVAMMLTRRQDPAYREIDFDAMLELYSKITKFDTLEAQQKSKVEERDRRRRELQLQEQRQRDHQLQLQQQQQAIDLSQSRAKTASTSAGTVAVEEPPSPRTYTELRPVRGKGSASEVLQRHHEENRRLDVTVTPTPTAERTAEVQPPPQKHQRNPKEEERPIQPPKSPMPVNATTEVGPVTPRAIKQEVMPPTPLSVQPNDSVVPGSMYPGPGSVEVVRDTQRGVVGNGNFPVKIHMELDGPRYTFGPINVRTEEEIQLLMMLVREKCDAASHRGKTVHAAPQYYSQAERAKSILHPEVVKYINYAFTKKGMKEHQKGRKRNNYPKRSQIIKIDKETGEKIYPKGHPMHMSSNNDNAMMIKQEPEDTSENLEPSQTRPYAKQPDYKRSSDVAVGAGHVAEKRARNATSTRGPSRTSTPSGSDIVRSNIKSILATAPASPSTTSIDCPPSEETTSLSLSDHMQQSNVHSVPSPLRVSARKRTQKSPSERPTAKRAAGLNLRSASAADFKQESQMEPQSPPSSLLTVENLAKHQKMAPAPNAAKVPVDQQAATKARVKYRGYENKANSVAKQVSSSSKSVIKNIEDMMSRGATATMDSNTPTSSDPKTTTPPPPSDPVTRNQARKARDLEARSTRARISAVAVVDPNPPASPMASSDTYVRSSQKAERIRKILERKERKKELLAAAAGKYRGYDSNPSAQAAAQPVVLKKFSEAEVLGGVKKVVRSDGTVVKIPVAAEHSENVGAKASNAVPTADAAEAQKVGEDQEPPKKAKKLAQTSQEEQDLMAELFEIADSIEEPTASTSNNDVPTASQGFETGPKLDDDFPTFEDLF